MNNIFSQRDLAYNLRCALVPLILGGHTTLDVEVDAKTNEANQKQSIPSVSKLSTVRKVEEVVAEHSQDGNDFYRQSFATTFPKPSMDTSHLCPVPNLSPLDYIGNTQHFIKKGSKTLNKSKSVVVVYGPQYYDKGFIDPIDKLLDKCENLILLDYDAATLMELSSRLKSKNVTTQVIDFSRDAYKYIVAFEEEVFLNQYNEIQFLERVIEVYKEIIRNMSKPLNLNIPKADYCISSLVAYSVGGGLFSRVLNLFKKMYNKDIFYYIRENLNDHHHYLHTAYHFFHYALFHKVISKHIEDMQNMTKSDGKLYFSVDILNTYVDGPKKGQEPTGMIGLQTLKKISQLIKGEKHSWTIRIDRDRVHTVVAYIADNGS